MFNTDNSQYISVVKYHSQLKIDYKLLKKDEIISSNQSAFLLRNEFIPQDVIFKINNWQKELNNTYLSTLLNSEEQVIMPNGDDSKNEDYRFAPLNTKHKIGVKKSQLFEEVHYFDKIGLDFLYSPFHILNLHIEQNTSANNLVVLVLDNHLYINVLNESSEIVYHYIKRLTSFDDIKDTEFFESEVVGQKLFDEVYYLEIQNTLQNVITEFYASQSDIFIEKIVILYTLKQLNAEQIDALKEDFLIDINYHPISIDESIYELSKDSHTSKKSFIPQRKKTTSSKTSLWVMALALSTMLAAGAVYYLTLDNNMLETVKKELNIKTKEVKVKPSKIKIKKVEALVLKTKLPNHIIKNREIEKRLMKIFDLIPFDVLLRELTLEKDDSTLEANFLKDDIYIKTMQPTFLKQYKSSEIKFEDIEATVLNATVHNSGLLVEKDEQKVAFPKYIKDEFLPQERVNEQLKDTFPQNGIIKYKSTFKSEVTTFNYIVNIIVDTPLEFLEIIEDMNKELYSMNISYPVMMRKTIDGIEIEFSLQFHQEH